jgi:hypothetical protein
MALGEIRELRYKSETAEKGYKSTHQLLSEGNRADTFCVELRRTTTEDSGLDIG